ncbi:MAG: hypothetical protein ACKVHP_01890, partial [Verrucomicrobiales bacterium]
INNPNGQAAINQFYQMLGAMPSKDIANLILDVDKYPNHSRRRETREMIIDYLAMADPMKALEVHDELPTKGIFGKAFKQLGRTDPAQALAVMNKLENSGDKSSALSSIFVGASEVDPAGAFELLKKTEGVGPQHYHEVFDNWAESDPTTAAKMALTVESPAARREALKIVGQEWAEGDPLGVLDWISNTEVSAYERETMRSSALEAYAKRDAKAAMDLLANMDPAVRNRALPGAMRRLMDQDPDAAIAWIRDEPDSFAKFRTLKNSVYALANKAPEETIALAREFPEIKDNALSNAFSSLASNDLQAALDKAAEWKNDPEYANIMSNIAAGYGNKNPEEALEWANGLEEGVRENAMGSAMSRLARNDPSAAIKHLDDLGIGQDDPVFKNSVRQIASSWAQQDPVSASEWINTLPNPELQTQAISTVADRWADIDPVSASEWIGGLSEGPARDQAATQLINQIQRDDPESAAAWAASIGDENQRNNALSNVFRQWTSMDPNSALGAIQNSALPDEMKQNFLQRIEGTNNQQIQQSEGPFGR